MVRTVAPAASPSAVQDLGTLPLPRGRHNRLSTHRRFLTRTAPTTPKAHGGEQTLTVSLGDQLTLTVAGLGQDEVRVHHHRSVSLVFPAPLMSQSSAGKGAATSGALTYLGGPGTLRSTYEDLRAWPSPHQRL
ncbi:hypothetical protein Phou_018180 [Phytohabitans houttuyneae]|uniref:Uncharacterized protein n=1 Tax=Phytohabitans houttuyneae TaxID=1076126 RepID=A0A6V8K5R2_9ACTN|nr:hypothetical protein Phou_018180 [Phytohabitans houttuyneae]